MIEFRDPQNGDIFLVLRRPNEWICEWIDNNSHRATTRDLRQAFAQAALGFVLRHFLTVGASPGAKRVLGPMAAAREAEAEIKKALTWGAWKKWFFEFVRLRSEIFGLPFDFEERAKPTPLPKHRPRDRSVVRVPAKVSQLQEEAKPLQRELFPWLRSGLP